MRFSMIGDVCYILSKHLTRIRWQVFHQRMVSVITGAVLNFRIGSADTSVALAEKSGTKKRDFDHAFFVFENNNSLIHLDEIHPKIV